MISEHLPGLVPRKSSVGRRQPCPPRTHGNEHQPADAHTALLATSRSGTQVADLRTLTPKDVLTAWPVSATEGGAP